MNGKKIADFVLLKPVFTGRNLTSLILVAIFFGVYIASGGRVRSIPKVSPGETFGAAELSTSKRSNSKSISEQQPQTDNSVGRRSLFGSREVKKPAPSFRENGEPKNSTTDLEQKNNSKLDPSDRLRAIQNRLKKEKQQ